MTLDLRPIGKTKVQVTSASFGCASIGNLYRACTDAEACAVLQTAWDAGIRYFDTAPHYGRGLSEQRLGMFLHGKTRGDYVISTKVGRVLTPGAQQGAADGFITPLPNDVYYDYSGDGIEAALDGSRSRLGAKYIDIVYVHDIGTYTHGDDNAAHIETFLADGYARLIGMKERGEIGAIGLGVNENEVCIDIMQDHPLDVILLAGRLTLLDRSAEKKLVAMCREAGTSLVLGGVFNSGILATGAVADATFDYAPASAAICDEVRALESKAKALDIPLATAALMFAKHAPQVASVLIGTARSSTLARNLDAFSQVAPRGFDVRFGLSS